MEHELPRNRLTPARSEPDAAQRAAPEELMAAARDVFRQQATALEKIASSLSPTFSDAVRRVYACQGRVLVTGLGKSGLIARKVAATLTSTGTPALFVHPVEAVHGDLGIATAADVLLAISRSGRNEELLVLQSSLAAMGLHSIVITGRPDSPLARRADVVLAVEVEREACPLDLTPTTSTTAALVMGDALAMVLLSLRDFRREDFAVFHPSGLLGRTLRLTVKELMHDGARMPVVLSGAPLRDALLVIAQKRLGCTCVVDDEGRLVGFLTDGDLKRILLRDDDPLDRSVDEFMTTSPRTVAPDCLARVALRTMESNPGGGITQLVVVQGDRPLGIVHIHDILKLGLSA
jgi:arabinose-5-phosphate isomerase